LDDSLMWQTLVIPDLFLSTQNMFKKETIADLIFLLICE